MQLPGVTAFRVIFPEPKVPKSGSMSVSKNVSFTSKHKPFRSARGFSVTEFLIASSTLLVLGIMVLPMTMSQIRLQRLNTSVATITGKLDEARMTAVKRNRSAWLFLDRDAKTAQIRSTDSGGATVNIGNPVQFSDGLSLDGTTSIQITFDSMGNLVAGANSFELVDTSTTKRKAISVSAAGKVTVGEVY
jgi:Tfp pilus assembly protein FimT